MKKFSFSMEKILELRRFEQKEAELDLGRANAEVSRIQNTLNEIAEKHARVRSECDSNTDFFVRSNAQNFFLLLDSQKEKALEEMAQAQLVAEEKRKVVQECMQKVKVLEKLREKKFNQWKKEMYSEEEQSVDDIVTARVAGEL